MVRNLARLLALTAIAAVAVGVYLIVHSNVATDSSTAQTHVDHRRHHDHHHHSTTHSKPAYYTVQAGDSLSAIAHKTGVPLPRLETLNPSLSPPFALQTGERLRLRQ
jgi:LysM repeat protein